MRDQLLDKVTVSINVSEEAISLWPVVQLVKNVHIFVFGHRSRGSEMSCARIFALFRRRRERGDGGAGLLAVQRTSIRNGISSTTHSSSYQSNASCVVASLYRRSNNIKGCGLRETRCRLAEKGERKLSQSQPGQSRALEPASPGDG
ncbi:hypothetical protein CISG_04414 [Coccidioides immitis RMSCC 3703]|uniref:Uncharacterized protein n=1 Tax=Coccidioides immitis RMSCC 3703 TaxID=454286 RepID=A0A0J8QV41_COCIT|nr:hypothetical protein CISG_04414 [Coccidioides immitis RMSCC 3703]